MWVWNDMRASKRRQFYNFSKLVSDILELGPKKKRYLNKILKHKMCFLNGYRKTAFYMKMAFQIVEVMSL